MSELVLIAAVLVPPTLVACVVDWLVRRTMRRAVTRCEQHGHPAMVHALIGTVALAAIVFSLYAGARALGGLPPPDHWAENHGPWRWTVLGVFCWGSFLIWAAMIPAAAVTGGILALLRRRVLLVAWGLATSAACVLFVAAFSRWVYWTID